jgi:cyclase
MFYLKGFFSLFTAVVGLSALATMAAAQGRAPVPFMVHELKPNVYFVDGAGCNSGVIVGEKGVIVVDAKLNAAQGKELVADIAKITPKPITTVILTHSDADHVNGLVSFPQGITIIASENAKKEQQAAIAAGSWAAAEKGAPPPDPKAWAEPMPPPGYLPTQVISKKKDQIKIDGVKLELLHWGPAHTSGDLVIYLPDQKIVFTGDITSTNHPDPTIHEDKAGSSEGFITTTQAILALNAEQFVPGHGELQTKADIQKRLSAVEAKRAKIKELVAQGKSLEEIRVAVGDPPPPQPGSTRGPIWPSFTEVVYREFTNKRA